MKRTADSSTTSEACPKSTSRGRRASGIASGSIPTAITRSTPRRYDNGGSGQSNKGSPDMKSVFQIFGEKELGGRVRRRRPGQGRQQTLPWGRTQHVEQLF